MGVAKLRKASVSTKVPCPSCRYPNLGIDIWCERCGGPMESSPAGAVWAAPIPEAVSVPEAPSSPEAQPAGYAGNGSTPSSGRPRMPVITFPKLAMPQVPRLAVPSVAWPRLRLPAIRVPKLRRPEVPRLVLVVAAVLALLLIAPLAYVLIPSIRAAAVRPSSEQASNTPAPPPTSEQSVAIAGVKAKTGLPYAAARCATSGPCLTMVHETRGQDAAAVLFSTAGTSGRQCVTYVYRTGGSWRFLEAACGLPGQLSPLVGQNATVHVPGNCANVRDQASLNGRVVGCLNDGTTVHIDGGPNFADGRLWWHEARGWIAHDFLTGP